MKCLIRLFLVFLVFGQVAAYAGGNKKNTRVSFHLETSGTDNPKMIFPHVISGEKLFFRRVPEISSLDFVAFSPFPSDVEGSYGVVFQLKDAAARRLAAVSSANQEKWLVCQAFGRVVDAVIIDRPVNDGMIVVWKGVTLEEIAELDKNIPRIGEEKKRG
jgi:hypothetical protein